MLWMAVLGVLLVWSTFPDDTSRRGQVSGYQISPKPCWIDGLEGTCMFVYECIKSEGYHIGMCVDTFMFGSCCAHNSTANIILPLQQNKPTPSQNSHTNNEQTSHNRPRPTTSSLTKLKPASSFNTTSPAPSPVASKRPGSSRNPTQPPRHSVRPLSTDLSLNHIVGPASKPGWQSTTEPPFVTANNNSVSRPNILLWPFTTESNLVTRVKSKPNIFKPKPKPKPTKKPISDSTNKYGTKFGFKPLRLTTAKPTARIPTISVSSHIVPHKNTVVLNHIVTSSAEIAQRTECGVPRLPNQPQTRIVGGKTAPFGRWPWQVSVRRTSFFGFSSTHRCGGAVLNENWIATAGHCVDDLLTSQIRIRVGEYDFANVNEELPYVERSVGKKIVHPKYNFFTYEYDLALVQLDKPLEFAPHIAPICLPASDDLLIGENATVTGWGRLSEGGTLPSVLQEVQVPIVSNDKCKSMFLRAGRHEFIPEIFLCAGHEHGGQDSCQGDSGGPLQVRGKNGRYFLAGIISWGIGCAEANLPGVCTRISKFVPWILKNVT